MDKRLHIDETEVAPTRRTLIAGAIAAVGTLALGADGWGQGGQVIMPRRKDTSRIHQEIDFDASPNRIYTALLSSKEFAKITHMPAKIDPKAGGAFSTFGGLIGGRNVELVEDVRIVQAWRPGSWPAGVYSIVKFELKANASGGTTLALDHAGFPEDDRDGLTSGWSERYWEPLKKYLAG